MVSAIEEYRSLSLSAGCNHSDVRGSNKKNGIFEQLRLHNMFDTQLRSYKAVIHFKIYVVSDKSMS